MITVYEFYQNVVGNYDESVRERFIKELLGNNKISHKQAKEALDRALLDAARPIAPFTGRFNTRPPKRKVHKKIKLVAASIRSSL